MSKKKKHVLIVEDDSFLLDIMRKVIGTHGVRVSGARDGKEAIRILDKDMPDVMVMDLLMPKLDGYGVLEHRKEKKLDVHVVVCTNISDKTNKMRCKGYGISAYIIKSDMDDKQLWPVVEKCLK